MLKQKRLISWLAVIALVLGSFAVALPLPMASADQIDCHVITFDTADKCQNGTVGDVDFAYSGNAAPSFDAAEGALLMTTTGTNAYVGTDVTDLGVLATEYPVLAYRIKVKTPSDTADYRLQLLATTTDSVGDCGPSNYNNLISGKTGEWQTYTVDFSASSDATGLNNLGTNAKYWANNEYDASTWKKVTFNYPSWRSNGHAPYYVAWMGFFKSEEDAKAYEAPAPLPDTTADNHIIRFDGEDDCQNGTADHVEFTYSGNATPSYDATEDALLMTTTGTNAYITTDVSAKRISATAYPVLAYCIKVKDPKDTADLRLQLLASTTDSVGDCGPSNYNNLISGKTGEWQLYTIDFSASSDTTGLNNLGANAKYWENEEYVASTWKKITFNYPSWRSNGHAPYYVAWMGFFKSEEDAKAYEPPLDTTAPNHVVMFDGEDDCQNGTADGVQFTYSGNATPSYDATEQALLMTTTGTNAYITTNVAAKKISATAYPVLAYRIKVKDPKDTADLRLQLLASTNKSNGTFGPSNYNNLISGKTGEWQTYTIDFSADSDTTNLNNLGADSKYWKDEQYANAVWNNIAFNYPSWRSNGHSPYYVAWIGFFKSEEDAKAFEPASDGLDTSAPQHIVAFDAAGKCVTGTEAVDNVKFTYSGAATPSYDIAENALLMTTAGTNAYVATNVADMKISATAYPVLAYRIKVKNPADGLDLRLQLLASTSESNTSCGPSNYNNLISGTTGEWQTYTIDFSADTDTTNLNNLGADSKYWKDEQYVNAVWNNITMNYPSWRSNGHSPYYIAWMGFFKSEEDAKAYEHKVERPLYYFNAADKVNTEAANADGIKLSTEQASISYDEATTSMKVVTTGTANQGFAIDVTDKNISTIRYPVVAYRLRLAQVPAEDTIIRTHPLVSTTAAGGLAPSSWSYHKFWQGEDGDTVIWNFADSSVDVPADGKAGMGANAKYWTDKDNYSDNTWKNLMFYLPNYRSAGTSQTYYVEWVGFFTDKASAEAMAEASKPERPNNSPAQIWRFDTAEKAQAGTVDGVTLGTENVTLAFESNKKSLQVTTAATGNRGITMDVTSLGLSTFDYPVLAYRVRLAAAPDADKTIHGYPMVTTQKSGSTAINPTTWTATTFAAGMADKTIAYNFADSSADKGVGDKAAYWTDTRNNRGNIWTGLKLFLPSYRSPEGEMTYYIDWVGFFPSMAAAEAYRTVNQYDNVVVTFDTADKCTAGKVVDGIKLTTENVTTSFDESVGAMLVTDGSPSGMLNRGILLDVSSLGMSTIDLPVVAYQIRLKEPFASDTLVRGYPMALTAHSGATKINTNTWAYHNFIADKTKAVISWNFADSRSDLDAGGKTGVGDYAKYWNDKENHSGNTWDQLRLYPLSYREASKLDYYIEWIGFFPSQEALDEYRGIVRKEGQLFYDFSKAETIEETRNRGYDSALSYDAKEQAMMVTAVDGNGDGQLTSNVAGFSLGSSASNETLTISDTAKYPVLALRVKLKNPTAQAGWFNFCTSTSGGEYPMAKPSYRETNGWQTVTIHGIDDNTMPEMFEGNWDGLTLALAASSVTELNETFYVKWVGVFESIEAAYAYTGEKPPVKEEETPEELPPAEEEPEEETPVIDDAIPDFESDEFGDEEFVEPEEIPEDGTETLDMFLRVKAAASSAVSINGNVLVVNSLMTAQRLKSAFALADGVSLVIENEKGQMLKEDTLVYNNYQLVVVKDGVEKFRLTIEGPVKRATTDITPSFWGQYGWLIAVIGGVLVLAAAGVTTLLLIRRKRNRVPAAE